MYQAIAAAKNASLLVAAGVATPVRARRLG